MAGTKGFVLEKNMAGMVFIKIEGGGTLPKVLEGLWTDTDTATAHIRNYQSSVRSGAKMPKQRKIIDATVESTG